MSEPTNQNTGSQGNQGQQGNVAGVNYGVQNTFNVSEGRSLSKQEYRNRQNILTQMRTEVESRLTQSIHRAAFVNLGKEQQPQQVQRPWDMSVKVGEQRSVQLPPQTTILDVFDNPTISGKFLILGKPGGGKTTTLLELAEALIARAEGDSDAPIPVILELSTWQEVTKREFPKVWKQKKYDPSIKEWVLSQLISKGVSQNIGEQWLREKELVLLLDGLDELQPERQGKCVRAINQFLGGEFSPLHLVVCSRKEEYENYEEMLQLNGAICLEDLTNEQIRDYFASVNLGEFWESIKESEKIVNFIRQPLFLAITSLAYQQIDVEEWRTLNTEEEAINYLLGVYRFERLGKKHKSTLYPNQVPEWLITKNRLIKISKIMEKYESNSFNFSEKNLEIIDSSIQKTIINTIPLLPYLLVLFYILLYLTFFAFNPTIAKILMNLETIFVICLTLFIMFDSSKTLRRNIKIKVIDTILPRFVVIKTFKLYILEFFILGLIEIKNIFLKSLKIQKSLKKSERKLDRKNRGVSEIKN
ncbi:NACHT domain-containing protein [Laspinema olomoucense]|uniref:NACHT domain-containing protein n=1 Tax=Laspinema olomoucense TaxID=3231600 RepID=UPI00294FF95C|nr:NACHT domain-containing protein [Laspinema sp. D3b]